MATTDAIRTRGRWLTRARLGWAATVASLILGAVLLPPFGPLLLVAGLVGAVVMTRKTRGAGLAGGALIAVVAVPAALAPIALWADGHRPNWTFAIACAALLLAASALWLTRRARKSSDPRE